MDIEEYRKDSLCAPSVCMEPPLVSYPMVLQRTIKDHVAKPPERSAEDAEKSSVNKINFSGRVIGLQRPTSMNAKHKSKERVTNKMGMYAKFMQDRNQGQHEQGKVPQGGNSSDSRGSLAGFLNAKS